MAGGGKNRASGFPIARLGPAFAWLRDRGVSPARMAGVFGLTPGHVRQLVFRERKLAQAQPASPGHATHDVGVRKTEDATPPSEHRRQRIDDVLQEVERIRTAYIGSPHLLDAAVALKELQQFRGFPSNPGWLRVIARLYRERAWFLVHSGHVASAISEGENAIAMARLAHRQRPNREDLVEACQAALIVSHAHLLAQEPLRALSMLEVVEAVSEAGSLRLGSDYHRQRGVALLQQGFDDAARKYFDKSAELMQDLGEGSREAVLATGVRHTHYLRGDWDGSAEVAWAITAAFGGHSLQASVANHWAAACGLSSDSTTVHQDALFMLEDNLPTARAFGHQHTIAFLLSRTLDLGLPLHLRREWIRYALYVNAFRHR